MASFSSPKRASSRAETSLLNTIFSKSLFTLPKCLENPSSSTSGAYFLRKTPQAFLWYSMLSTITPSMSKTTANIWHLLLEKASFLLEIDGFWLLDFILFCRGSVGIYTIVKCAYQTIDTLYLGSLPNSAGKILGMEEATLQV